MRSSSATRYRKSVFDTPPALLSDLSRHLLRAQEEERKRISRELHDEAGQGLMVLRLHLGMLAAGADAALNRKIEEAMDMLDGTIADLRRLITRLSPRVLEELGLLPAIRKEARELSKTTGMKAHLELPDVVAGLDHEIEIAVYRAVQEALNNIAKHAQAEQFWVQLDVVDGCIRVRVEDDGVGFGRNGSSISGRSFGLVGMRERIAALAGSVRIQSRKGRGTRVKVIVPVANASVAKTQLSNSEQSSIGSKKKAVSQKKRRRKDDSRTASAFSRSGKGDSSPHEWRSSA